MPKITQFIEAATPKSLVDVVVARFGVLTLGVLASCGVSQSQTQDCATTQAIASYTHPREVTAESQHASSGGYLEFGEKRCTVYVDYVPGAPLRLRLWTAHHCYNPTQGKASVLALYDQGRYVDIPVVLDDAMTLESTQKTFLASASQLIDENEAQFAHLGPQFASLVKAQLNENGVVSRALKASFSGVPRTADALEPPYAQCLAFEAEAKEKNRAEKGSSEKGGPRMQRVCASYHDLVVFDASVSGSASEPLRALLARKASDQAKAMAAGLAALPEGTRTFVRDWRNAYDTYLAYKRFSSVGAFYRDALKARAQCASDSASLSAEIASWCALDSLIEKHLDERLAGSEDGLGKEFDTDSALRFLHQLKEEPPKTRDAVARRYFLVEDFEAFKAALDTLKGESLRRFLVQGADLLLFYAGKNIEQAWARLHLGNTSSEVSLARAPFLFHTNVYFVEGDSGRAQPETEKSLLGPYFVKRQAVSLTAADAIDKASHGKGVGGRNAPKGLKVASGALLFERPLTPDTLRVLPGDSGSLFTLYDLPVAVVSTVNGEPTSGGQVLRPLPKQTAEQEPPGEGPQSNTAEGSAQGPKSASQTCQI